MTHVNNVQSFEKLLGICTGYGGSYNPGKQNLRVENLSNLLMQAREKLLQVSVTKSNHEQAQNDREIAFAEMRQLTSRILAELKSSGALPQTVADATVVVRKISGYIRGGRPIVPRMKRLLLMKRSRASATVLTLVTPRLTSRSCCRRSATSPCISP
jgi:hypothetical protein